MHCTAALLAADTSLVSDEGAWGCKTRVAGAQVLHTCVPAQPHMHVQHIICCTAQHASVFGVYKFLAATHMIFERDLSKWVVLHLLVPSAPLRASLFMRYHHF